MQPSETHSAAADAGRRSCFSSCFEKFHPPPPHPQPTSGPLTPLDRDPSEPGEAGRSVGLARHSSTIKMGSFDSVTPDQRYLGALVGRRQFTAPPEANWAASPAQPGNHTQIENILTPIWRRGFNIPCLAGRCDVTFSQRDPPADNICGL